MRDLQQRIKKRRLAVLISLIGVLAFASLALSNGPPSSLGYEGSASFVRSLVPRRLAYDMSTTTLPSYTDNDADVWFTLQPTDTPFFWYIPRSGGATLQKIAAQCLNLVSASPRGIQNPHPLGIYRHTADKGLFLNVDTGSLAGIDHGRNLNMTESGYADIYISQHLVYSEKLFSPNHKARMFTMLRNPVKRAIDLFYYRQRSTWDPSFDPSLAKMTLNHYAYSDKLVTNFMVRALADVPDTLNVTSENVEVAKEILRQKFLVGIHEWYDRSIIRFEKYFGWYAVKQVATNGTVNYCHYRKIKDGGNNGRHIKWAENQEPVMRIKARNWADWELYSYAKKLFIQQAALVPS